MTGVHYVYRCYDTDGNLLYVGCTRNVPRRMYGHRHSSAWYPLMASLSQEAYDTRQDALDAERRAIRAERPPHNTRDNPDAPPDTNRGGRPAGLLLNPLALDHLLGDRPQAWLADAARVSAGALSELAVGARGATTATADRLASALGCAPGVLFPELAGFTVAVRYFTASGAEAQS